MILPASTCVCMDLYFGLLPAGFLRPVVKSKYLLTKFIFLAHPDHVYCVAWELTVSGIYALSTSSFFFFAEHCAQFSHGVLLVALWRRCWSSVEIFTSNEKERIIVLWFNQYWIISPEKRALVDSWFTGE